MCCPLSRHSSNQHYYLLNGEAEQMEIAVVKANNRQTAQIDYKCILMYNDNEGQCGARRTTPKQQQQQKKHNAKLKSKWKSGLFFLANNSSLFEWLFLSNSYAFDIGILDIYYGQCVRFQTQKATLFLYSQNKKTYVPKLVFPTKQMKFRKAGKLYNNEFNFEVHTHTHTSICYF